MATLLSATTFLITVACLWLCAARDVPLLDFLYPADADDPDFPVWIAWPMGLGLTSLFAGLIADGIPEARPTLLLGWGLLLVFVGANFVRMFRLPDCPSGPHSRDS